MGLAQSSTLPEVTLVELSLEEGYVFEDVIAKPWAADVIQCMLGPRPSLSFYNANMAFTATR